MAIRKLDRLIGGGFERREITPKGERVTTGTILEIKPTYSSRQPWRVIVSGSNRAVQRFTPDEFARMGFDPGNCFLEFSGYRANFRGQKHRKEIVITFFPASRRGGK